MYVHTYIHSNPADIYCVAFKPPGSVEPALNSPRHIAYTQFHLHMAAGHRKPWLRDTPTHANSHAHPHTHMCCVFYLIDIIAYYDMCIHFCQRLCDM